MNRNADKRVLRKTNMLDFFAYVLLGLLLIACLPQAYAANDPGHDTLYLLLTGGNITGALNLTSNLTASGIKYATLLYGDQLDIRSNGSIAPSPLPRAAIQAASTSLLYIDASTLNIKTITSGGMVQIGDRGLNDVIVNISGNFSVYGTIKQQNILVCLANGSNCPSSLGSANITGSGAANKLSYWTSGTNIASLAGSNNGAIYYDGSGNVASATLPVLSGGTGVTTKTGTDSVVLNNSPVMTTPTWAGTATGSISGLAGTATALAADPADCGANTWATTIASNGALTCSAVTYAGISAMTSANFASIISDETGTGNVVLNSSPIISGTGTIIASTIKVGANNVCQSDGTNCLATSYQSGAGGWSNTTLTTTTALNVNVTAGNLAVVSGKVGIGTASPGYALDVNGGAYLSGPIGVNVSPSATYQFKADNHNTAVGSAGIAAWGESYGLWSETPGNDATDVAIYAYNYGSSGYGLYVDGTPSSYFQGNVGIGIKIPTAAFHVNSSSTTGSLLIQNTTGTTHLFVNGSSGNVGIGTTTASEKLTVVGNASITNTLTMSGGYNVDAIKINGGDVQRINILGGQNVSARYGVYGGLTMTENYKYDYPTPTQDNVSYASWVLTMAHGNDALFVQRSPAGSTTLATLMSISSTGNVGINTITPTQKLDVNGSLNISGASAKIYTPEICIAGSCQTAWPSAGNGGGWTNTSTVVSLVTTTNNVSANTLLVDNTNGRVGIGTTTPFEKLSNTGGNILDQNSVGTTGGSSFSWVAGAAGYTAALNQTSIVANANGLLVRIANGTTNRILTLNGNGTDQFVVLGNGNVGIGTTIPASMLHVNGSVASNYLARINNTNNAGGQGLHIYTADGNAGYYALRVDTTGGTKNGLAVENTGNVGIGTISPNTKLEVGAASSQNTIRVNGDVAADKSPLYSLFRTGSIEWTMAAQPTFMISANPSSYTDANLTSAAKLAITSAGNVGIGTAAPTVKLAVGTEPGTGLNSSAAGIIGITTYGTERLTVNGNTGLISVNSAMYVQGGANVGIGNAAPTEKLSVTGNLSTTTGAIFATSSGSVGIGTGNPGAKLESYGNAQNFTGIRIRNDAWACDQAASLEFWNGNGKAVPTSRIVSQMDGCSGTGENLHFQTQSGGSDANVPSTKMIIKNNGLVGIGTTTPWSTLTAFGTGSNPSLTHQSAGIASFASSVGVDLLVSGQAGSPYSISMQTRHTVSDGFSYPLALNPLGGSVGIGTTAPGQLLDVNGIARQKPTITWQASATTTNNVGDQQSSYYSALATTNVTIAPAYIDGKYYLLLAPTANTSAYVYYKISATNIANLDVNLTVANYLDSNTRTATIDYSVDNGATFTSATTANFGASTGTAVGATIPFSATTRSGDIMIRLGMNGSVQSTSLIGWSKISFTPTASTFSFTPRNNFLSLDGNIGVGIANPAYKLDTQMIGDGLNDVARFSSILTNWNQTYGPRILFSGGSDNRVFGAISASITNTGSGGDAYLSFYTRAAEVVSEKVRITNTGNVGIGTIAPGAMLHVHDASGTLDAPTGKDIVLSRYWASTSDTRGSSIFHYYDSTAVSDRLAFGVSGDGGTNGQPNAIAQAKMVITAAGNVMILNGSGTPGNATGKGDLWAASDIEYEGNLYGPGADLAELINASEALEAGDVVVANPSKAETVMKTMTPYSTAVIGVVSSDPGIILSKNKGNVPLALAGRVPIKVSAENGPIKPGDLLTTSSTAGYAMRCTTKQECQGAIVAKSLGTLESGMGKITGLVMLG